jgi:hypothetical protein
MTEPQTARRRFLAAVGLYVIWIGVLAAMAVTSAEKPRATLIPPAAEELDRTPAGP